MNCGQGTRPAQASNLNSWRSFHCSKKRSRGRRCRLADAEFEADDALAAAAVVAARDSRVERVIICTPDKDLAQCVCGARIVQLNRRTRVTLDEPAVVQKFGVSPASIPDYLALVGDAADGYYNTTGIDIAGSIRQRPQIVGYARFNGCGGFNPNRPLQMIGRVFECAEPCVWQGQNKQCSTQYLRGCQTLG